ncbi:bromodomain adjacent to zinc finger domain protein 2B-like isoform X5 [Amphibalanus amphitrite]|uniref:bromodomain adjacent to zinc finger domain protein 2B-like isoform X5 n=1 Tax=Amphibalanus amphitrite TaxID=1232801 RepID=UPI001C925D51|nr:bromodomain adjacent to zinc finger domain protein 2B-like isoform X5 [Amphibalanus amphitrite]
MEKDSKGGSDKKRSSKDHGSNPTPLDPSLFAHSLFGGAAAGFNPMMMPGFPMMPPVSSSAATSAATSAAAAHAALASMASNPALGANAAWLSLMHQMAAQDYLSRLQSGAAAAGLHSLAGLPQYEALTGMKAPSTSSGGSGSGSSSSKSGSVGAGGPCFSRTGGPLLPDGTEIIKHTSSISGPKVPGTTNRGRKKTISLDPPYAAAAAAAAAAGGSLTHGVSSILGRSPATETRLTDSVTITPTSSKSTSDRLRQLEMLGTKVGQLPSTSGSAQVTITPVAAKGTTMLTSSVSLTPVERAGGSRSPPTAADGPLNLSKKPPPPAASKKRSSLPDVSAFPGGAAAAAALGVPLTPEMQMEQLRFHTAMASAQKAMAAFGAGGSGSGSSGSGQRRSRAKKLGVGVSRPKKNTVASLLANSRGTDDGSQPGGSGAMHMSTDELTIEVRPRSSTAPAAAAGAGEDDDALSVKSAGSSDQRKHKVTSSTDEQLSSFPYSSYLARLKREYEDSSGMDSEELSDRESECEVSSSRGAAGSDAAGLTPSKRRRVVTDERKLRVPLDRGWRRETTIRKITQAGPRGDVVYYAPCGKAFRQFPDILRYLERNNITDVTRDHFTFSSKVVIGDYLKISEDGEECIPMSEAEVKRQVDVLSGGKSKRQFKKPYVINIKSEEGGGGASGSGSGAGPSASSYHQAMELMRQLEEDRRARQLKEEQKKKERELKNLQMLEERRRKQEELEKQKAAENLRKAQELNKQREMLYRLEVERERRRHHMLLVKALDARRRQEERDRRREDMKVERAALKERRREKRLQDAEVIRQLKKPREDMALTDQKPLPELARIPGLRLSGEAFANTLMVFEFLHNFGETLGFDMESLPSLGALQQGLLNEPDHEEELLSVLTHLVVCAVEDPGIPHPVRHVTCLNQTLRQADITHTALSEVLRIYMFACASGEVKTLTGLCPNQRDPHCRAKNADFQDAMDANRTYQMSQWLTEKPYLALNPTEKTEILAHLCNDLLQNKAVLRQIDSTIEVVNTKRKEKWNLDGRLRRMRMLHAKKFAQRHLVSRPPPPEASENCDTGDTTRLSEPASKKEEGEEHKEEDEEEEEKDESGNESEPADEGDINDEVDINSMSAEELHKRIEQLSNHNNQLSRDIYEGNRTIRPTSLGQDRFHRAYWVLPRAGGIYVESLESGVGADERYDQRRASHQEWLRRREAEKAGQVGEKRPADSPDSRNSKRPRVAETAVGEGTPVKAEVAEQRLPNGDATAPAAAENGLSGGESPRVNGGSPPADGAPVKMETDVKAETPADAPLKVEKQEPPSISADTPLKAASPAPVKVEPAAEEGAVKSEPLSAVKPDPAAPAAGEPSVQDSLSAIKQLAENPVAAAAPAAPKPSTAPSHAAPLNSKHLVSYLNASLASLGASGALKEVNGAIQIPGLGLVPSQYLLQALQAPEKLWFSVLPKDPCDFSTITELSDDEQESVTERGGARAGSGDQLNTEQEDNGEDEAQEVPQEYKRGWWRVSDTAQIDQLVNAMHNRGIRERPLKNKILTCKDTVVEACELVNPAEVTLSSGAAAAAEESEDESEEDGEQEQETAPEDNGQAETEQKDGDGDGEEKEAKSNGEKKQEKPKEKAKSPKKKSKKRVRPAEPVPEPDAPGSYRRDVAITIEMSLLEHVENLEERIAQASMQFKSWRLPPRTSGDRELFAPSCEPQEGRLNAVTLARDRLIDLEQNIERRYLKPPLGTSKGADLSLSNLGTEENNTIPRPLLVWRDALPRTSTAAQVSMCLYALEMSVAWDKSIMKAQNCQFCTSGDHEEKLLLCDGCDKGYHTYCFKPAMDTIPDGDWYCFECVNKATGERACVVCGKGEGKVLLCEGCPRAFHPECVTPPVAKVPRGKWHCPACAHKSPKKSRSKKAKPPPEPSEAGGDGPAEERESPPKKERGNKKLAKEMAMCRTVLAELEAHDEAWPFLLPVNTKQFPTYKKIIKSPMDLSTIKKRINEGVYKSKDEFTADMRIIFNNCETFNEDDSPVGKAGHSMRTLFEARWLELNPQ